LTAATNALGEAIIAQIETITNKILELVESGTPTPIILIDGRTGSGKTTFASALQNRLFQKGESAPRVIHMDDLYEGWNGLQAGVDYLVRQVLGPLSRREGASWQEYDWSAIDPSTPEKVGARSGTWREFRGGTPLIIEGVGSLSRIAAEQADITVWLEVDQSVRLARIADRNAKGDGDGSWFTMWTAQEADFYAREKSDEIADLVIHT
jgi:DNA polymerase III delta prime subunit